MLYRAGVLAHLAQGIAHVDVAAGQRQVVGASDAVGGMYGPAEAVACAAVVGETHVQQAAQIAEEINIVRLVAQTFLHAVESTVVVELTEGANYHLVELVDSELARPLKIKPAFLVSILLFLIILAGAGERFPAFLVAAERQQRVDARIIALLYRQHHLTAQRVLRLEVNLTYRFVYMFGDKLLEVVEFLLKLLHLPLLGDAVDLSPAVTFLQGGEFALMALIGVAQRILPYVGLVLSQFLARLHDDDERCVGGKLEELSGRRIQQLVARTLGTRHRLDGIDSFVPLQLIQREFKITLLGQRTALGRIGSFAGKHHHCAHDAAAGLVGEALRAHNALLHLGAYLAESHGHEAKNYNQGENLFHLF